MRTRRRLLFLFVVFTYFPLAHDGLTAYKVVGAGLAITVLLTVVTRRRQRAIIDRYTIALVIVLYSGLLGAIDFGDINLFYLQKIAMNIVLFIAVAETTTQISDCRLVLRAIAIGGLINVLFGVLNVPLDATERVGGLLDNANGFGQVCAQTGLALVGLGSTARRAGWRWLSFGAVAPCILGLLHSASRGSSVSLLCGLLVLALLGSTRRAALVLAILAVLIVALLSPQQYFDRWQSAFTAKNSRRESGLERRIELSVEGYLQFRRSPVFGVGPGNVMESMRRSGVIHVQVTHNAFAQVLAETGAVGTLAFLFVVLSSLRNLLAVARSRLWRARDRVVPATVLALFVAVIVGQMSSGNYIHTVWYVLFGMGHGMGFYVRKASVDPLMASHYHASSLPGTAGRQQHAARGWSEAGPTLPPGSDRKRGP